MGNQTVTRNTPASELRIKNAQIGLLSIMVTELNKEKDTIILKCANSIAELESEIEDLKSENSHLKSENSHLKSENSHLKLEYNQNDIC